MSVLRAATKLLIPAGVVVGAVVGIIQRRGNTTVFATDEERMAIVRDLYHGPNVPQLIVVKADWCTACKYLEGQLLKLNLPYIEADIDTSPAARKLQRRLSEQGQITIPQLIYKRRRVLQKEIATVLQELADEAR